MSHNPMISVIIATYRRVDSLQTAIESVVTQICSYAIEIIVVDDNADPNWNQQVKKIVEQFHNTKPKITLLVNPNNLGSAASRNSGISVANGTYISFLDDDDIYGPNKLQNQIEGMLAHQADYSITDLSLYSQDNRLIERRTRAYITRYDKKSLLQYHFMYHMTGTDTLMFRRDYLVKIGGFPPIDSGDEFYLMKNAIDADGKFVYLPFCDVMAYVHTGTGGLSSGDAKIAGENRLYMFKQEFFNQFDKKSQRYITTRHFLVLAFAELRRKNFFFACKYGLKALFTSPSAFIRITVAVIKK